MTTHFEDVSRRVINKFKAENLEDLCSTLLSALTTDITINAGIEQLNSGDVHSAFNQFAISHSTLLHHRLEQKRRYCINRNASNSQDTQLKQNDVAEITPQLNKLDINNLNVDNSFGNSTTEQHKQSHGHDTQILYTETNKMFDLLKLLPPDWTVIQLTCGPMSEGPTRWKKLEEPLPTPVMYLSRATCGSLPTLCIQEIQPYKSEGVRSIVQELDLITEENKVINKKYGDDQAKFANKRQELNDRLKCLVKSMETAWLCHWTSLFTGSLPPREQSALNKLMSDIITSLNLDVTQNQIHLLQCMISAPIPPKCGHLDYPDKRFPMAAGIAAILGESVRSKVVKNIVSIVKDNNEVLENMRRVTRNPAILIIDKAVVSLPWEMLSVLREQPVTRVPSLQTLVVLYEHHSKSTDSVLINGIISKNGFYLLDPDNNLPRSQNRLRDFLLATEWSGITAEKPSHEEFKSALSTNDLFVYIGHGSGSQYLPGELVEGTNCRTVTLLYGCASVRLSRRGRVPDPWGVVLNYLIASCPCIVGMLWEVSDKDTDIITKEMLSAFLGMGGRLTIKEEVTDIALIASRARSLCNWYINAAALTVYGLPLHCVVT